MRFVLLVVVIVAAVWFLRRALRTMTRDETVQRPPAPGELVSCVRCGLHLPRSEAREANGALFCSEEHARLGAGPKG